MFAKQLSSSTLVDGVSEVVGQTARFLASRSDADLEIEIQKLEARPRSVYIVGHFLN